MGTRYVDSSKSNNGSSSSSSNDQVAKSWCDLLDWITNSLCNPPNILPLPLPNWPCAPLTRSPAALRADTVIGTVLIIDGDQGTAANKKKRSVKSIFQNRDGNPFLILDLPVSGNYCELDSGPCRIALECDRARSGGGPLLGMGTWTVYVNGRRMGFGWKREMPLDANDRNNYNNIGWALEVLRVVSIGVGVLTPPSVDGGGGRMEYLRGRFERVVGSADSESYHLVDPAGCMRGHELSFFFVRL